MKTLKAAVIGAGHLGKEHARLYRDMRNVRLAAICDSDPQKADLAKSLGAAFTTDYRDLFGSVDLVSVATPTSTHHRIACDFLNANIHTLIEKPIANDLQQADDLIELATQRGLTLQVGHLERYNAGFRRVEQLARGIRFIEVHRLGPFNPRINDCGVVLDLMIHDLDLILLLVKSDIETIDATGVNVLTPFEDIANVRIKFKNKAIANVTASRLTPEVQRKIRIFQDDAYISLDYVAQSAKIYRKSGFPAALFGGKISCEEIDIRKEEPLRRELEDFVRAVTDGSSNGKPDVAAREALAVALRILESIKENAPEPAPA